MIVEKNRWSKNSNHFVLIHAFIQNQVWPLYFTHWHVPRRNKKNKIKPPKLGLNELQTQSGYSTGCSINQSPITYSKPGPLHLHNTNIPPPPKRSPPAPPITVTLSHNSTPIPSDIIKSNINNNISDSICDADNEKSDSESEQNNQNQKSKSTSDLFATNPILNAEEHSLPQMAFINSLHLEIKRLQLINEKLIVQNRSVISELDEEKHLVIIWTKNIILFIIIMLIYHKWRKYYYGMLMILFNGYVN